MKQQDLIVILLVVHIHYALTVYMSWFILNGMSMVLFVFLFVPEIMHELSTYRLKET
jgi:hypothetical protein